MDRFEFLFTPINEYNDMDGYVSIFDLVPHYKEAVEEETHRREADFLSDVTSVCGIKVYKLNMRLLSVLTLTKNPLVTGGSVKLTDAFSFLWIISVEFSLDENKRKLFFEMLSNTLLEDENTLDRAVDDINKYLSYSFEDCLSANSKREVPYVSGNAALVDLFASEYGWTEQQVFNAPLRRIWQYIRAMRLRHDPKALMSNPSDKVKMNFMGANQ